MPRKKGQRATKTAEVSFSEKKKVTAYYAPKDLSAVSDDLREENRELGLLGTKDEKSHSDLLVTLANLWHLGPSSVRQWVREAWGMGKGASQANGTGKEGTNKR